MRIVKLIVGVLIGGAVLVLAGCGTPPPPQTATPLAPQQRAQIASYFVTNPYNVPQGWHRGVLVTSQKTAYNCPFGGGACWTWSGTAITPDGSAASLESVKASSDVYNIVSIGDDFLWTNGPSYSYEVKVLDYGAVPNVTTG